MNSAEKKRRLVVLVGPAQKSLDRIPPNDRARIRAAIDDMEENPLQGDVCKLEGSHEGFRRRVGDWRIFFDLYLDERGVVVTTTLATFRIVDGTERIVRLHRFIAQNRP
jgi:mRNA-degrading endonuclease RelE of RelBE toxin-antitoxin system